MSKGSPQPAEFFAGSPEELGRSSVGLFPRFEHDTPARTHWVFPRQVAIGDVRQIVEEFLLREQQQVIRAVPRRGLLDVQFDDAVVAPP